MKTTDMLYKHTLARVGPEKMRGIDRLVAEGHRGIAEKHTVSKLMMYVKDLENRLGIEVPDPQTNVNPAGFIKINTQGSSYFVPSMA